MIEPLRIGRNSVAMPRLRIVLVAPRIAANVASIARSVLGMAGELHLVGPFGFFPDVRRLDRASVGYWQSLQPVIYPDFADFGAKFEINASTQIIFATKRGTQDYSDRQYLDDVVLIFGNEEEGVPQKFWEVSGLANICACRIPTREVRCLNLGVSVAVMGFEVCRQWSKRDVSIKAGASFS